MSINPHFLDELRNRLTLSEIIGRRIKVTRAGRESKACCPFHHEKTPSFTINDEKQFYHCFGCGAHGDVINFVMQHDNVSFIDAVESLATEAGMQVPKQTPQQAEKAKKEKDLYSLLEEATAYFEANLREQKNSDAMGYLLDRGFSEETISTFRIGFAPENGQLLRKHLISKGYDDKSMIQVGLLKASTRGGDPYAFFRDRIVFPVPDRRGRIIAFGGRILPEHIRPPSRSDFTPPKYINSSETILFHKGRMLYGEPIARRASADGEPLVLVEGYLDVIACAQAGVRGALAPMGTAVTEEQIISMWKMIPDSTKIPILCFDGDNAGRKAARRVSELILPLLEAGQSVRFAFMPDGEDPDSLIKDSGVQGFKKVLANAVSLFDFIWAYHTIGKDFKTPELRAGVIKQLEDEIARIANKDVQVHYRSLLRQRVSDTFFAKQNYDKRRDNNNRKGMKVAGGGYSLYMRSPLTNTSAVQKGYHALLAALINFPYIFEGVEDSLCDLTLENKQLERMRQKIIDILSDDAVTEREDLVKQLENFGFTQEIGDICNESVYLHASFCSPSAAKEDVLSKWLEYWNDIKSAGLEKEIRSGWKQVSNEEDEKKMKDLFWMDKSADESF